MCRKSVEEIEASHISSCSSADGTFGIWWSQLQEAVERQEGREHADLTSNLQG